MAKQAIMTGQAWIAQATEHEFQPQELRLHQREGVNYDKGCYLGQKLWRAFGLRQNQNTGCI